MCQVRGRTRPAPVGGHRGAGLALCMGKKMEGASTAGPLRRQPAGGVSGVLAEL
jgi:hypothetical protein